MQNANVVYHFKAKVLSFKAMYNNILFNNVHARNIKRKCEIYSENVRGDVTAPSNLPSSGQHKNNNFHQNCGKLCQITCMTSILMWRNFETVRRWGKENGEKRRVL